MRHILRSGGEGIELNALFIQPTRWCALDCAGCYVKEHAPSSKHLGKAEMVNLFKMFHDPDTPHWANQITVSIDDIPKGHPGKHLTMHRIHYDIVDHIHARTIGLEYPETHFTYHTTGTLRQYIEASGTLQSVADVANAIDMMSFSYINPEKDKELLHTLTGLTQVNYNHLIPANVTSKNIDRYVDQMVEIAGMVHSIYIVIFKRPIRDKLVQLGDAHRMRTDMAYINTMLSRVPESVRRKIHIDGCLQDVAQHRRTGFGCSSNVSRFQVWPDGSVTGCAYAWGGAGSQPARTANGVLENIRDAKRRYEFKEDCHLPEVYDSVLKGGRDSSVTMGARTEIRNEPPANP